MNSSFDSVLKGIKVDAANWHALGQLKPKEKFEVDYYGKKPKLYMGETAAPGLLKKIKNTAKAVFTYTPSEEEASRGIVRISYTGMIGGLERTVNRTYFDSVATAEDTIQWLDNFMDKTLIDATILRDKYEEPMPAGLNPTEQKEFKQNKTEMLRALLTLRNEVTSSKQLITNLQETYSTNTDILAKLNDLESRLNGDSGLIKFLKNFELEALSHLPIQSLIEANATITSFETISEKDPIDVITLNERAEIKNAWKTVLKKIGPLEAIKGEPEDIVVMAPHNLVVDLNRTFGYRLNGVTYASNVPGIEKHNSKQFYLEMNRLLGEEAAKRIGMLLNQTVLMDIAIMKLQQLNMGAVNHAQVYELSVENEVVTIGATLTGHFINVDNPFEQQKDFFYKVAGTFSLEELQAADFSEKVDPLTSLRLTELIDVSKLTDEQRTVFEALQWSTDNP